MRALGESACVNWVLVRLFDVVCFVSASSKPQWAYWKCEMNTRYIKMRSLIESIAGIRKLSGSNRFQCCIAKTNRNKNNATGGEQKLMKNFCSLRTFDRIGMLCSSQQNRTFCNDAQCSLLHNQVQLMIEILLWALRVEMYKLLSTNWLRRGKLAA